jgi:transposase
VIWVDGKYHNYKLQEWIENDTDRRWRLEVKRRPADVKGFVLLPKRWVVERTHPGLDAAGGTAATMSG